MNKTFFMALMLASGMALAQSSGSYGSQDQSQPSSQQTQPSQPSTQPNQPSSSQNPTSSGQNSLTGCLKGSDGSWVLIAQGQSTPVTGDSSTLSPHNGHQVQLKGTQASDGSFQVTDVVMIAESCPSQQSDASTGAAAGAVRTVAQTTSAPDQSPSNPQSTSPNATQSTSPASGQNPSTSPSTTQPSAAGQTSTDQTGAAQKKLPQTASPLPLLGLLGFGSLVTGLIARRRK